ncbi:NudC domain containing 1 [Babesia caballi]|uniref:NudC domain containing 1 n=1 Tax=Babesia caballi TaxID=5871 RepID=A0AAV4M033_BABCB|nr:NudC domain containing 1 [Babesia caballi]
MAILIGALQLLLSAIVSFGVAYETQSRHRLLFLSPMSQWPMRTTENGNHNVAGSAQMGVCNRNSPRCNPLMVDPLAGIPGVGPDPGYSSDFEGTDDGADVTEADIAEMMQLIKDVKQGKMGPQWKQEMEAAEDLFRRRDEAMRNLPGMGDDTAKPNVAELLNESNEDLDEQLRQMFDLSDLRHPTDEEIARSLDAVQNEGEADSLDEADERHIRDAVEGKLQPEALKDMVRGFFREKGLLNEPVVRTPMEPFDLNWRQNKRNFDIWFRCLAPDDTQEDYAVRFLPQELTITYKGTSVSRQLRGKVDVDGCFWSMQELPDYGKVVGIVLVKRAPAFSGTWEHIFSGTPPARPPG